MRDGPGAHNPHLVAAINQLLSSGGKRIRPTLVLLGCGMLGAGEQQSVTLAAAIEMLHTATLVHDDLIDGSTVRRGLPTLNAQWNAGATVLTGDYIFARAAHLAAATKSLPVMESFSRTLMTIVNGEITQLFRSKSGDLRRDYIARIYAKTASLFELAAESSALVSASDEAAVSSMKGFGYDIGMAFQIVDDVIDFTGDQDRVGKPVGRDMQHGLITLPTLNYMAIRPDDKDLASFLQHDSLEQDALERLFHAIRGSGAVEQALDEARRYVSAGEEKLARMPAAPERDALFELSNYVVHRSL